MVSVVSIQLVRERKLDYPEAGKALNQPEAVCDLFGALFGGEPDREHVVAIMLDTRHRPTSVTVVSQGTLDSSLVHPREVFKAAILSNAAGIILVHNHPSGDVTPSPEDLAITRRLERAGAIMGIKFVDHVVVGGDDFLSMKRSGIID